VTSAKRIRCRGLDLFALVTEDLNVVAERLDFVQRHAPAIAPLDRPALVVCEVDVVRGPEQREDFPEIEFLKWSASVSRAT